MNKMFKKITMAFAAVLVTVGLTACGAPKQTPTEVAGLYLDAILYQKFDELNAHTGLQETPETFYEEFNKGLSAGLGDMTIDEQTQAQLFDALLTAIGNVTYEVVGEDVTKDTAVVTVAVKGINFDNIFTEVQKELQDKIMNGGITEESQIPGIVFASMVKNLKEAKTVETPIESTLILTKVGNKWAINDEASLESFLTDAVLVSSMM